MSTLKRTCVQYPLRSDSHVVSWFPEEPQVDIYKYRIGQLFFFVWCVCMCANFFRISSGNVDCRPSYTVVQRRGTVSISQTYAHYEFYLCHLLDAIIKGWDEKCPTVELWSVFLIRCNSSRVLGCEAEQVCLKWLIWVSALSPAAPSHTL